MSNIHRLRSSERIFFITTNLNKDEIELAEPEFRCILETIQVSRQRFGFLLCGYVLMPDHWHALLMPRFPLTISTAMQQLKRLSSRKINKLRNSRGSRWQHQFWDRFVRNSKEFAQRLEYMHYNPVRKGLVNSPEDWLWSSYNNFSLDLKTLQSCPVQIDYVHLPDDYHA
jgi:putative transposase